MELGTLVHPTVKCFWGGTPIHFQDVGGQAENMLQQMTLTLTVSDAPKLEFQITANPFGFKLFELLSADLSAKIRCEYGYRGSGGGGAATNKIAGNFNYTGMQLTTGMQPSLAVTAVGEAKKLANVQGSQTNDNEQGIPLKNFPDTIKSIGGKAAAVNEFEWGPSAKKVADRVDVKNYVINQTPYKAIQKQLNPLGIQVAFQDSFLDGGKVMLRHTANAGGLEGDSPKQASMHEGAEPGQRKNYIIGLGLVTNLTRKQEFNLADGSTNQGAAMDAPQAQQVNNQVITEEIEGSLPSSMADDGNNTTGTAGIASPSNPAFTNAGMEKQDIDAASNLVAGKSTTINFECLMVPYMVGIKPEDMIAIASLKDNNDYVEDYEVTKVVYTQNAQGVVMLSIEAKRPYTGGQPMPGNKIGESLSIINQVNAKGVEGWTEFYWNQGEDIMKSIETMNGRRDDWTSPMPGDSMFDTFKRWKDQATKTGDDENYFIPN